MIAGAIAGIISAFGYLRLNKLFKDKLNLHDTCGVQFLHAIPGVLGAFVSVIAVAAADYNFENDMQVKYNAKIMGVYKKGRTTQKQACFQLAGMAITLAISISSGLIFGWISSKLPMPEKQYDDSVNFMHVEYGDSTAKYNDSTDHDHNKVDEHGVEMTDRKH